MNLKETIGLPVFTLTQQNCCVEILHAVPRTKASLKYKRELGRMLILMSDNNYFYFTDTYIKLLMKKKIEFILSVIVQSRLNYNIFYYYIFLYSYYNIYVTSVYERYSWVLYFWYVFIMKYRGLYKLDFIMNSKIIYEASVAV